MPVRRAARLFTELVFALVFSSSWGERRAWAATQVSLAVQEPAGITRSGEPVTSGIPISTDDVSVAWALFDGAQEIPLQTTVLPGDRTPWLLLDFQTDVDASTTKTLTLKPQAPTASAPKPLVITEDGASAVVVTGPLKVLIDKTDFDLLGGVWLDRNGDDAFDVSERVVAAPTGRNITVTEAETGLVYAAAGAPTSFTWDYQGPLRATLRVDGSLKNAGTSLMDYTTRITFYAGQKTVRVDHVLRNSLQTQERYIKARSAQLIVGAGAASARVWRSGDLLWAGIDAAGASFELLPSTIAVTTSYKPRVNAIVDVDANGGMIIGDLSYHGASLQLDFTEGLTAPQKKQRLDAAKNPLFALAPGRWYSDHNAFGLDRFGTYDDEKNAYRNWGWTWPVAGNGGSYEHETYATRALPEYNPSWSFIHASDDPESDDLWQNLLMYVKTGARYFFDRSRGWARYKKWEWAYRTDGFSFAWDNYWDGPAPVHRTPVIQPTLSGSDASYIQNNMRRNSPPVSHMWAGGLVDYYYMTGDKDALQAAIDIAEQARRYRAWLTPGTAAASVGGGNARAPSRYLMIHLRTWEATLDQQWMDAANHVAKIFAQSPDWDARGYYLSPVDNALWTGYPSGKYFSSWQMGIPTLSFYLYSSLTQASLDPTIISVRGTLRTRLLAMADFVMQAGLDPSVDYTGEYIVLDHPAPGAVTHLTYDTFLNDKPPASRNIYFGADTTTVFLNLLDIAYRLTGDRQYLTRGRHHWDRGTKRHYIDPYSTPPLSGPSQVGRFSSSTKGWGIDAMLFPSGGDETNTCLFFKDAAQAEAPPSAPANLRFR